MKLSISKLTHKFVAVSLALTIAFTTASVILPHKAEAAMSAYSIANGINDVGNRYLGTPYRFGSPTGVTSTFDCSSFMQFIFSKYGMYLPRTSLQQSRLGTYVSFNNLRKGDLVFFWTSSSGGKPGHVAFYAGMGMILHTYGAGGVKYSNINSSYWRSHFIAGRRVLHF